MNLVKMQTEFLTTEDISRISTAFSNKDDATKQHIQHCISQLKRFSSCITADYINRVGQFFYNLGRLQELLGERSGSKIWWNPLEDLLVSGKIDEIGNHIDMLRSVIGVAYDEEVIAKGY